ncbi:hypothetical protein [Acinetobacter lwoffii]|uniref:hypothetical protein n=1 Tax=Acinetobacter lwoffii TaxID=28090 RepID=UPI00168D2161|nr:hypothetical protein [Acinetobacter lwoffii]
MNTKVDEGKLISGKEALIALANGETVEFNHGSHGWVNCLGLNVEQILGSMFQMRLKPRTITINGIEVPAPFEPKDGDKTYYLNDGMSNGYRESEHLEHFEYHFGAWRTEEEIKQVVAALRQVFGGSHDN